MVREYIPYGCQNISDADVQAVVDVLRSEYLTQGPAVKEFEKNITQYTGASYAVAVSSATAALHLASLATGVSSDDICWTVPNTFVASANCFRYCGAEVDFVDIDPGSYLLDVGRLEEKLKATSQIPKVVLPVHFAGSPCDMSRIERLAKKYSFSVIEDASHALGSEYHGKKIGNCSHSDAAVFSFHAVKNIATGEGGMIVTNSREIYEKLLLLRTHGITRDDANMQSEKEGPWYYQQVLLGFNYRMTDIQAALGTSQLKRLESFLHRRRQLVARYELLLSDLPLTLPSVPENSTSAWHIYVLQLDFKKLELTRKEVFESLRAANIGVNVHYIPVHLQPYYQEYGFKQGAFPVSERYYEQALTLPLHPSMTDEDQNYVVEKLAAVLHL